MAETCFSKAAGEEEIEMRAAQRMLEMTVNLSPNMPANVKEAILKKIRASRKMEEIDKIETELKQSGSWAGGLSWEDKSAEMLYRIIKKVGKRIEESE
jgi:hypothetical protein